MLEWPKYDSTLTNEEVNELREEWIAEQKQGKDIVWDLIQETSHKDTWYQELREPWIQGDVQKVFDILTGHLDEVLEAQAEREYP